MLGLKLIPRTDKNLRPLLWIYQLYGPPDSLSKGMESYPFFFGNDFYSGRKIYDYVFDEKRKEIFKALLDRNSKQIEGRKVKRMLDRLDIPTEKADDDKFFRDTYKQISTEFNKYETKANSWIKRVFGMSLPDEATLILAEKFGRGTSGGMLVSDPVIIGYCINVNKGINSGFTGSYHT